MSVSYPKITHYANFSTNITFFCSRMFLIIRDFLFKTFCNFLVYNDCLEILIKNERSFF